MRDSHAITQLHCSTTQSMYLVRCRSGLVEQRQGQTQKRMRFALFPKSRREATKAGTADGKDGVEEGANDAASVAGTQGRRALRALGRAPPCKAYKDLVTLPELQDSILNKVEACMSKEDLKQIAITFKDKKNAIQELVALAKASTKDLEKAVTAAFKRGEQMAAMAAKQTSQENKAKKPRHVFNPNTANVPIGNVAVFAALDGHNNTMESVVVQEIKEKYTLQAEHPVIARFANFLGEDAENVVKMEVTTFKAEYEDPSNTLRANPGRAQKKLSAIAGKEVIGKINEVLEIPVASAETEDEMVAHAFGLTGNTCSIHMESKGAPTARWSHTGTRKVFAVSKAKLERAMKDVGIDGKSAEDIS
eukprot:6470795-Amphidinium_carterae.1